MCFLENLGFVAGRLDQVGHGFGTLADDAALLARRRQLESDDLDLAREVLDGLFFVVRAGRTSMRFAKMGIATIRQRGAPILGLIVNGVPIDNPYYYYTTYYYSSYYHRPLSPDENMYQDNPSRQAGVPPRPTGDRPGAENPAGP